MFKWELHIHTLKINNKNMPCFYLLKISQYLKLKIKGLNKILIKFISICSLV